MAKDQAGAGAFVQAQIEKIMPLVTTLREGEDWDTAVTQVFDQIEAMGHEEAQMGLFAALVSILSLMPRD